MKALTIKQPYAGSIFARGKDVENRAWSTSYRGTLVIHSSQRGPDGTGVWSCGAVLGVVDVVGCVRDHTSQWAEVGMWHWVLRNPRALPEAIPARGAMKFWDIPPDIAARLAGLLVKQLR